jgi:hypothetical protein
VLAVLQECHRELMRAVEAAEADATDPAAALRARTLVLGEWGSVHRHRRSVPPRSVSEPVATVTAKGRHHWPVIPYRNANPKTTGEPLHTLGTVIRRARPRRRGRWSRQVSKLSA